MSWLDGAKKAEGYVGSPNSPLMAEIVGWPQPTPSRLDRIEAAQVRIEAKLDALIAALADEGEEIEQPELTLDGESVGGERDESQPL